MPSLCALAYRRVLREQVITETAQYRLAPELPIRDLSRQTLTMDAAQMGRCGQRRSFTAPCSARLAATVVRAVGPRPAICPPSEAAAPIHWPTSARRPAVGHLATPKSIN